MFVLVINCGSSSLKAAIINHQTGEHVADLRVDRMGSAQAEAQLNEEAPQLLGACTPTEAIAQTLPLLVACLPEGASLSSVGHRVVHGGERFSSPTLLDEEVEQEIEALIPLAPLHNPANLMGIRVARELFPALPHVVVFDTAFHATLPRRARTYALPLELSQEMGLRRYGFHGISHEYVAEQAARYMNADIRDLRLITCHLGNGCSVCAVEYGRSIETSMGMTPLEGLVMGTRSGDLDPGVILHLLRQGYDVDALDDLLNRASGLTGLSGVSNDMRDIEARAAEGDERARVAMQVFAHRVRRYIGAYAAVMGGVDAIVFTGGIGENSAAIRQRVGQRLDFLGAILHEDLNRETRVHRLTQPVVEISARHSRTLMLAVATDESRAIAREATRVVQERDRVQNKHTIPVAISARHVHLTQESVEALFGPGHQLTFRNPLSQPGQFACEETVKLIGPKREIDRVRILGPVRSKDQVEVSRTDEFTLGLDAPVRASGDVDNSPGITLEGPHGRVELKQGVICAWRHIHMTPEDAEIFGVQDRDVVEVAVNSNERDLIFGDVLVRVSPKYKLEMHIDTDEGNAANLSRGAEGALIDTNGTASLRRRHTRFDRVEQ